MFWRRCRIRTRRRARLCASHGERRCGLGRRAKPLIPEDEILALGSGDVIVVSPGARREARPVVLVASPYLPFPLSHGGAVRMYNLMRRAAARFRSGAGGLLGDQPEAPPRAARDLLRDRAGEALRHAPAAVDASGRTSSKSSTRRPSTPRCGRPCASGSPAIAQLEFTQMAQYAADCAPARTILVEHDITLDLYQQLLRASRRLGTAPPATSAGYLSRSRLGARWTAWSRCRTKTARLQRGRATRASCSPTASTSNAFSRRADAPEPRRLLFIGSFAHLPNVWRWISSCEKSGRCCNRTRRAAHHCRLTARVFPGPLSGPGQVDLTQPGIEVEDFVADVRPAYERATVVIAPLVASAGTNIKIMEAMAMGKAIVSTPAGINGSDLHPGHDVIVTSTGAARWRKRSPSYSKIPSRVSRSSAKRARPSSGFDWDAIAHRQRATVRRTCLLSELDRKSRVVETAEKLAGERPPAVPPATACSRRPATAARSRTAPKPASSR